MKIPSTFLDLDQASHLPYREGNALISRVPDKSLVDAWGRSLYGDRFGNTFMHASDHHAALLILLNREPTYREVQDSAHLHGSRNIDAARVKSGGEDRPSGWNDWTDDQKKLAVLVRLYGTVRGSRIADGRAKDPSPEKTKAMMLLWGLKEKGPTEEPPAPEPPLPEPPPQPPMPPIRPPGPDLRRLAEVRRLLEEALAILARPPQ